MNADLAFANVEFFGAPSGQRVRVHSGETFGVKLNEAPEGAKWATTNDPVLDVSDNGNEAVVFTHNTGSSEIQIQVNRQVVMYITVDVVNPAEAVGFEVPPPVISLEQP